MASYSKIYSSNMLRKEALLIFKEILARLKVSDVKKCTKPILKGLCYLHDRGIVHGDIKLENILVLEDGSFKIADFGLAKTISEQEKKYALEGTPVYMSPELLVTGKAGAPSDIWALGCIVLNLITGKLAWEFSLRANIVTVIYRIELSNESPEIPSDLCNELKDILGKCLLRDTNERWTAKKLLDYPFVTGFDECGGEKLFQDNKLCASPKGHLDWDMESETSSLTLDCRVGQMVMNEGSCNPNWANGGGLIDAC